MDPRLRPNKRRPHEGRRQIQMTLNPSGFPEIIKYINSIKNEITKIVAECFKFIFFLADKSKLHKHIIKKISVDSIRESCFVYMFTIVIIKDIKHKAP